ncbi:uncharacterized protein LOC125379241 [Haliotis rufescens]|uniref:uncharacterized protein LOC125379241 n=1 Tax=Haliotis rufescens TaxID=6454 RepID=UPI00201F72B3|nr:uncharacterized protein LOC125379241 [Haliotis rufescens]
MSFKFTLVYLDDILVYSKTFDEHLVHLKAVFDKLREANLKLKPSKCKFAVKQVGFLGHVITKEGIKTDPGKIEAVKSFPRPKNVGDLRSYLGLCGYYRKFVKDYAHIVAPLNKLLGKDVPFVWSDDADKAFQTLKQALISSPILVFPDFNKPFILYTDSSSFAIGFVLGQKDSEGRERVVAYGGKSLNKTQRQYHITLKECLALVTGVKHFHLYLAPNKFQVITDHAALRYLKSIKDPTGKLARWSLMLTQYDYEVIYRPGAKHGNADALSRGVSQVSVITHVQEKTGLTVDKLRSLQLADEKFKRIIDYLESDVLPDDDEKARRVLLEADDFMMEDGRLKTSPFHPETNSHAERMNSVIGQSLRIYGDKAQENWPKLLPSILAGYRMSPAVSSTGFSPYFMVFGREPRLPIDNVLEPRTQGLSVKTRTDLRQLLGDIEVTREIARENVQIAQEAYKQQFDKKSAEPPYRVGDRVWLYCSKVPIGFSRKLYKSWQGPFYVVWKYPSHTFQLRRCGDDKLIRSPIHANRLKPYISPDARPLAIPLDLSDDEEPDPDMIPDNEVVVSEQEACPSSADELTSDEGDTDAHETAGAANEDATAEIETSPEMEDRQIEALEKCMSDRRGKWYKVRYAGVSKREWVLREFLPSEVVEDFHIRRTMKGKAKRKHKSKQ